eukprot:1439706-Ditylum_brightwellii.AAC.1
MGSLSAKDRSHNGVALQDYLRNVGVLFVLKTDNAQSEVRRTWSDHCCHQCMKQETTEPDHPWQNSAEPKIGQLKSMVKNVMRRFNVPLKGHDWVQKWCVDVHNIASSRKMDWKSPLDVAVEHTQDISGF